MSDEQELRRRLQEIPGPPAGGLDVDAAVADARRRRRPKTAALAGAAGLAAVLAIAPFAAPALLPSSTSTMAERPASDAGAPAPESESGGGSDGGAGEESASAPEGAAGTDTAAGCDVPLLRAETGLVLRFLDDPADGTASVEVSFEGGTGELELDGLGLARVADDPSESVLAAPAEDDLASGRLSAAVAIAGGGTTVLDDLPIDPAPATACGGDDEGGAPAPFVVGSVDGTPVAGVGEAWTG